MDGNSSNLLNLAPLGIPTLIIADDPRLIAAARAAYAHWLDDAPAPESRLRLRLEIASTSSTDVSLDIRVEGSRLRLHGRGAEGTASTGSGEASVRVAPELLSDAPAFAEVLDTLLLFLLARSGRTPVHAAASMLGDLAIVLAGPSGSGKSTLALASSNLGYPILSDDMVFVQREPRFALWGFPRAIHVFPNDAPPGRHPTRLRNSKLKTAVPPGAVALRSEKAVLVQLERSDLLDLSPIDGGEAVERLMRLDSGFDLLAAESRAALNEIAARGSWKLRLSDDPDAAIRLLMAKFARAA